MAKERMAEMQAEAAASRLAAEAARARTRPHGDGWLARFARVLRLPSVQIGRVGPSPVDPVPLTKGEAL